MPWLWLLSFGIFVGGMSGLLGIGGGMLLIPGLVMMFGFSQAEAQGTSLAVMIPPIGIFAAAVYYQHGYVRLPVVGLIAAGFMVGAYFGARAVPYLPPQALRFSFGVLLLYLGFSFVLSPRGGRTESALPAGLAAVLAAVTARRWRQPPAAWLPPPGSDLDYHI